MIDNSWMMFDWWIWTMTWPLSCRRTAFQPSRPVSFLQCPGHVRSYPCIIEHWTFYWTLNCNLIFPNKHFSTIPGPSTLNIEYFIFIKLSIDEKITFASRCIAGRHRDDECYAPSPRPDKYVTNMSQICHNYVTNMSQIRLQGLTVGSDKYVALVGWIILCTLIG